MIFQNKGFKQTAIFIVIFSAAYLLSAWLTPVFQDMTLAGLVDNIGRGLSTTSASVR